MSLEKDVIAMNNKKIVSLLLSLVMFFSVTGMPAISNQTVYAATSASSSSTSSIESQMKKGFDNFDSQINFTKSVKNAGQAEADAFYDEISDVLYKLLAQEKYFYVEEELNLSAKADATRLYVTMKVKYTTSKSKLSQYKTKFDKAVKDMLTGVKKEWTDVQKVAYLHDKLVLSTSYVDNGTRNTSTPYAALVKKKATCSGYARAYCVLLKRVGIESKIAMNDDHGWNLVKLGKSWYHVDCTYDDSFINGVEIKHNVYHEYFLKSDAALKEHGDFKPKGLAKSTKFDKLSWGSTSPFFFYGKSLIYGTSDTISAYDTSTGKSSKLLSIDNDWEIRWRDTQAEHWVTWEKPMMQMASYGSYIYYNKAHSIQRYDPKTGKTTQVFSNQKSDNVISGMYVKDKQLVGVFMDIDGNESKQVIKKF